MALPHLVAVAVLLIGWSSPSSRGFRFCSPDRHPSGLYRFAVGVMQFAIRVEAYLLFLVDDYPPFRLE